MIDEGTDHDIVCVRCGRGDELAQVEALQSQCAARGDGLFEQEPGIAPVHKRAERENHRALVAERQQPGVRYVPRLH